MALIFLCNYPTVLFSCVPDMYFIQLTYIKSSSQAKDYGESMNQKPLVNEDEDGIKLINMH